jgi:hypothetical protein
VRAALSVFNPCADGGTATMLVASGCLRRELFKAPLLTSRSAIPRLAESKLVKLAACHVAAFVPAPEPRSRCPDTGRFAPARLTEIAGRPTLRRMTCGSGIDADSGGTY